jgi:hypothetical protein
MRLEEVAEQNKILSNQTNDELAKLREDILSAMKGIQLNRDESKSRSSNETANPYLLDIHNTLLAMVDATTTISKQSIILRKLRFNDMYTREDAIEKAHAKTFRWLLCDPDSDSNSDTSSQMSETESLQNDQDQDTQPRIMEQTNRRKSMRRHL